MKTKGPDWTVYIQRNGDSIRCADEKPPLRYQNSRPATKEEVADELARRKLDAARVDAIRQFNARADVKAARSIGGYIELNLEKVIDRLTPDEWSAILKRLEG